MISSLCRLIIQGCIATLETDELLKTGQCNDIIQLDQFSYYIAGELPFGFILTIDATHNNIIFNGRS